MEAVSRVFLLFTRATGVVQLGEMWQETTTPTGRRWHGETTEGKGYHVGSIFIPLGLGSVVPHLNHALREDRPGIRRLSDMASNFLSFGPSFRYDNLRITGREDGK